MESFELSSMVMALLAFPDSEAAREGLQSRLNKQAFDALQVAFPDWAAEVLKRRNGMPFRSSFRRDLDSPRIRIRLNQRMVVARMFRSAVREFIEGQLPARPPGLKSFSLNALTGYVVSPDKDQVRNFRKRWLEPTLPVLHIAIALDIVSCSQVESAAQRFEYIVHDETFISEALLLAIWLEDFVVRNPRCRVDPNLLRRLRPDGAIVEF